MKAHWIFAFLFTLAASWQAAAQKEHQWSTFDVVETLTSGILRRWLLAVFEASYHPAC